VTSLCGVPILTSEYLGELVVPPYPHPERLKRYKRRTLKRWCRAHSYYRANGTYYLMDGGKAIICHPDDLDRLRHVLRIFRMRLDLRVALAEAQCTAPA